MFLFTLLIIISLNFSISYSAIANESIGYIHIPSFYSNMPWAYYFDEETDFGDSQLNTLIVESYKFISGDLSNFTYFQIDEANVNLTQLDLDCVRGIEFSYLFPVDCALPPKCGDAYYYEIDYSYFGKTWGLCLGTFRDVNPLYLYNKAPVYRVVDRRRHVSIKYTTPGEMLNTRLQIDFKPLYDITFMIIDGRYCLYTDFCNFTTSNSDFKYYVAKYNDTHFYYKHIYEKFFAESCRSCFDTLELLYHRFQIYYTTFVSSSILKINSTNFNYGGFCDDYIPIGYNKVSGNKPGPATCLEPRSNEELIYKPLSDYNYYNYEYSSFASQSTSPIVFFLTILGNLLLKLLSWLYHFVFREIFSSTSIFLYPQLVYILNYIFYKTEIVELLSLYVLIYYKTRSVQISLYLFSFLFLIFAYFYY